MEFVNVDGCVLCVSFCYGFLESYVLACHIVIYHVLKHGCLVELDMRF
jgi:hypothetical protein